MGFEGYFTIAVIVFMIIALAIEITSADAILFTALVMLILGGVVSPAEAFDGFSNQGLVTVAVLFIVSQAVRNTGAITRVISPFLFKNRKRGISFLILKLMMPVTFLSAFLNNTPIVVIFVPIVKKWAEKLGQPPSKFLIPLSYAAMFGGICTLIGTSTNLVLHGLMLDHNMPGFSMFELSRIGIPAALVGWTYLAFIGHRFLPDRRNIMEVIGVNRKEYVVRMRVKPGCELIGKSILEAGLRNLKGLFLVEIERRGKSLGPVSSNEIIEENDQLLFAGITSAVIDLCDIHGLVPVEADLHNIRGCLVEAVISSNSPVLGKTIKECSFRGRYGAAVLAVHRNGERVLSKIGSIKLHPGDTLLLLASHNFVNNWKNSQDFYLISPLRSVKPKVYHKSYLALVILVMMVLFATFGRYFPVVGGEHITMLHAALVAAVLLVAFRCVSVEEARNAVRFDVLITIACALGICKGLQNSGVAETVAALVINAVHGIGPVGVLASVYVFTALFTSVITNNAAAALAFPIAYSAALKIGADPKPFFVAVAVAASASFLTPIGYQTNLIVQGAGGYKFRDYFKVGLPLSLLFFLVSMIVIPMCWRF